MTNITSTFNELLKQREANPTRKSFSLEELDGFLKEAYQINSHIASLHSRLKDVRQAYLSTAPQRKSHLHARQPSHQQILTDREREEVDANAKKMLRELNASIRTLADAEQLRHETQLTVIRKKYVGGLGALGAWASGGGGVGGTGRRKSKEHEEAEAREAQLAGHREAVIWLLRQRLQRCLETQQRMMETRLAREIEKSRSVLANAGGPGRRVRSGTGVPPELASHPAFQGFHGGDSSGGGDKAPSQHVPLEEDEKRRPADAGDLTQEELQMFEKGSQDMLKYYESRLDKVLAAEKSILEISELQTVLVNNLAVQSAGIEQLAADSEGTEANVGGGNKELKKATERSSMAKATFFGAIGLCSFLIIWDLLI